METTAVDVNRILDPIIELGAVAALMILVIGVLLWVVRTLYKRNVDLGDSFVKTTTSQAAANEKIAATLAEMNRNIDRRN